MKNIEKYYDVLLNQDDNPSCYFTTQIMKENCVSKNSCVECKNAFIKWLNEEYKKPITISADEKVILRNLPEEFKYIVRDYDNIIYICKEKPIKSEYGWIDETLSAESLNLYAHLFQFIEWEDDEPYSIEELLKEDAYEPNR